jgi:hypothetical protein
MDNTCKSCVFCVEGSRCCHGNKRIVANSPVLFAIVDPNNYSCEYYGKALSEEHRVYKTIKEAQQDIVRSYNKKQPALGTYLKALRVPHCQK